VAIVDGDMIRSSLQGVLDNLTASRIPYLIVSSQVLDSPAPVVRKPVRTPALLDALASVLPTPAEDDVAS
jgi:hypothetical protein